MLEYRPEIDGLRAVAVAAVVLMHAPFAGFGGGYVGVDVFFVISGYLITLVLLNGFEDGSFTLLRFYERRARRILPALYVVLLAASVLAWFVLPPTDIPRFAHSLLSVIPFGSNFYFWRTADYFAPAPLETPLLHTWTLGVEEQFYVLFPVLLWLVWRFARARMAAVLMLALVGSFLLSEWAARYHPFANFYLLPPRAWELLLGGLLAYTETRIPLRERLSPRIREVAAIIGTGLILYAIFAYNSDTPFPGRYALAPTVGSALVIAFGTSETAVGRFLSQRPIVAIGLMSYSIYLWHQPLFAFAQLASLDKLTALDRIGLVALTLAAAGFTWRFVETPFRKRRGMSTRAVAVTLATTSVCLVAIGAFVLTPANAAGSSQQARDLLDSFAPPARKNECVQIPGVPEPAPLWSCAINPGATAQPTFLLIGDSHARNFLPAFKKIAIRDGAYGRFVLAAGCPPLLGVRLVYPQPTGPSGDCSPLNRRIYDWVKANGIKEIFLAARWAAYTDGDNNGAGMAFIATTGGGPATKEASREAFRAGMRQTVEAYKQLGVHLTILEQIPMQLHHPPKIYRIVGRKGASEESIRRVSVSYAQHLALQSFVRGVFRDYRGETWVRFIDFDEVLCERDVCPVGTAGQSYYSDDDHLSTVGAARLVPHISRAVTLRKN